MGSKDRGALVMGVPITTHDHHQHAANEIRLTNLWDATTVYAGHVCRISTWASRAISGNRTNRAARIR